MLWIKAFSLPLVSHRIATFPHPGRTEIGGNHTDHQRGRVLAAAVDLDTVAAVRENGTDFIRVQSKGYPMCQVCLQDLTPRTSHRGNQYYFRANPWCDCPVR